MNTSNFKSMLSGGRSIVLIFAVFFALGGIGMRYMQKANNENAWRLANEGVNSLATITNKHTETGNISSHDLYRNKGTVTRYILEYSFPLEDSTKEWQGDDAVTEEDYNSVEIGDQFDVLYWSQDPDIATILEDAYAAGAKLAKNISTFLLGIAALLFLILLFRPVRNAFKA